LSIFQHFGGIILVRLLVNLCSKFENNKYNERINPIRSFKMNPYLKPEITEIKYFSSAVTATGDFILVSELTTLSCCQQESQGCEDENEVLDSPVLTSIFIENGEICMTLPKGGACTLCSPIDDSGNFVLSLEECFEENCTIAQDACCFRDATRTLTGTFDGSRLEGTLVSIEQPGTLDPDCGDDQGCNEIRIISADPA
jgi:hypothetical protein